MNETSFVFDFALLLYEHQSTINPNMPLRDLLYASRVLQGRVKDENLYSKMIVKIPAPKFVVFYNGTDFQPEQQVLQRSRLRPRRFTKIAGQCKCKAYDVQICP